MNFYCRAEIKTLERQREETLKDLRLIEGRGNKSRDEKCTEKLGEMGRTKSTSLSKKILYL